MVMKNIVIVVTYNRKELLEECINALNRQTSKEFDILVVDNASTDNTYNDVVKKYECQTIKYLNTGRNIGGAGGFNFGLKYAVQHNYDYAWVMDDDSICTIDAFESIQKKAEILEYQFSYIASRVNWIDGNLCIMNRVGIDEDKVQQNVGNISKKLLAIKTASFVGCYINLNYVIKVGLPIKEFFIYADDYEYTMRLSREECAYIDFDSIIIHKMKNNTTSEINTVTDDRISRYYYDFRNNAYIEKKKSKLKGIIKTIYKYFKYIYKIVKSKNSKKIKRIWIITKGTISGLFFNPKIEYVEKGEKNV